MSTGFECMFFEARPGKWYYALQNGNCPVGASDWTDFCTVTGPFSSENAAEAHLSSHEANPGGWNTIRYDPMLPHQFDYLAFNPARRIRRP